MIKIDESHLIRLAGVRAFQHGMHSFAEGRVRNVVRSEKTTRAVVNGRDSHEVILRHTHTMLEGECDCEASGGIDFCQHCVAVALALQEKLSSKKSVAKRRAMTVIRRHLSELSHEVLLDEFMDIVRQQHSLRDDLLQKVQFASGALSYADLNNMIKSVELDGEASDFREVRTFFEKFESLLLRINAFIDQLDPLLLLRAVEYAVHRLNAEIRYIDDCGDYWDSSTELLFSLHLNAVSRLDWSPPDLAAYLVDRHLSESWHPVQWGADLYRPDLGDPFRIAMFNEIESRLAAVLECSPSGTDETEPMRNELEELRATLEAGAAADG